MGDTKELDALASALNRSAERLQTLWFTFLAVTLYLSISAFTTTHRMLLMDEGQSLPILGVKLPLLPFYLVAPAFYLMLHAYILIMLVLLARTAKSFEKELNSLEIDRERYRMRMENAVFLQILIGGELERKGANGWVMRTIVLISLTVAPVLVLLLFQLMFLPYHNEFVTWWHRMLVVVDLVLVWTLWCSYRREGGERMLPRLRPRWAFSSRALISTVVVCFSVLLVTFPYERIHDNWFSKLGARVAKFVGGSEPNPDLILGLFHNRIWLQDEDLVDDERLDKLQVHNKMGEVRRPAFMLDFSDRDFSNAYLKSADLRAVRFDNSKLENAVLGGAWLQGSSFDRANLKSADLSGAQLQGASFYSARLQRASLELAQLQGSSLFLAELQGAVLDNAELQGAILDSAKLWGASLRQAQLQGASLRGAEMQGANLEGAYLQGANLTEALLDGAWLSGTFVWRAYGAPKGGPAYIGDLNYGSRYTSRTSDQFSSWHDRILNQCLERTRALLSDRLSVLNVDNESPKDELTGSFWQDLERRQLTGAQFQAAAAKSWEQIGCDKANGPFVIAGMIYSRLLVQGPSGARPQHEKCGLAPELVALPVKN
jgi:uncharacterized protein YjbI with pentapeptide repeats